MDEDRTRLQVIKGGGELRQRVEVLTVPDGTDLKVGLDQTATVEEASSSPPRIRAQDLNRPTALAQFRDHARKGGEVLLRLEDDSDWLRHVFRASA